MFPPLRFFVLTAFLFVAVALGNHFGTTRASLQESVSVAAPVSFGITFDGPQPFLQAALPEATVKPEWRLPQRIEGISDIEISALAVFAQVLPSHYPLLHYHADEQFPVASLTKLATALVAVFEIPPEATLIVSQDAVAAQGTAGNLIVGEKLSRDNLLAALLVPSSNDAAAAIAEYFGNPEIFQQHIAELIQAHGLSGTVFINPHGLDADGQHSTARDIAVLLTHALQNDIVGNLLSQKEVTIARPDGSFPRVLSTTNELLGELPGIAGGKTGFTDEARGTIALAFKPTQNPEERRIVILVVLGAEDRFSEAYALVRWIREAYVW